MRLALLKGDDPVALNLPKGVTYGNHGEDLARYPIDRKRLRNVLELAREKSNWSKPLGPRQGRGIAVRRNFLSYVANVVEVEVSEDGAISIPRVDVVADLGVVVNPDRVVAQFEGAAVFGASLALLARSPPRRARSCSPTSTTIRSAG